MACKKSVTVVGGQDDLELAATAVDADEVGAVAVGVQGHPGMTKGCEKIAFGDTSVDRCCHLDPCHIAGVAEPTDTSRICLTSSTILPQSAESSGYVCHADPSEVNPTPDHGEVCGFRRGGEKRDRSLAVFGKTTSPS